MRTEGSQYQLLKFRNEGAYFGARPTATDVWAYALRATGRAVPAHGYSEADMTSR